MRGVRARRPRSTSSWPLRRLPVFSHLSYRRSRSAFDAQDVRSLTSDRTSTKPTNFSASSAKTGENVSVSIAAQRVVGAAADADVVVDVDELAAQRIGEESGDEQRDVADLFEASRAAARRRSRAPRASRSASGSSSASRRRGRCEEAGEQLNDVERRSARWRRGPGARARRRPAP